MTNPVASQTQAKTARSMMSRLKQHFQREYGGIHYEACQKHDGRWWGYVPNAVSPQFKVGPLKDGKEALRLCLEYIKASQAKK